MKTILHLVVIAAIATVTRGDVTGTRPATNACFCFNRYGAFIMSSACGDVIGSGSYGQCFRYTGSKLSCTEYGRHYEYFQIYRNGRYVWTDGLYLNRESDGRCGGSSGHSVFGGSGVGLSTAAGEYTCSISQSDLGRRIHEGAAGIDCRDCRGGNTCRGGQCVALVRCKCQRYERYAPQTSCWRPGRRVISSNGRCNHAIPPNTAIATFDSFGSNGRYTQHAAVFIRCINDQTFEVYDQLCAQSVGVRQKSASNYATIINGCGEASGTNSYCQSESSGYTSCHSFRNQC